MDALSECLINLGGISVSNEEVNEVIQLYNNLADYDKQRTVYAKRHREKLIKGRFKPGRSAVTPGAQSVKR